MRRRPLRLALPLALVGLLVLSACGDDDDDATVSTDPGGSGIPVESDDPLVAEAVAGYTAYVQAEVDRLVADLAPFTDAVRAGDVEAAMAEFAPSRFHWETIEPIAGLISDIDGAVDARVDDFESETDPAWTGWHRLEHLLWETGTLDETSTELADQLDADIATLATTVETLEIPAQAVAVGAAELVEEVSGGKIQGEEDRYSHTDLWDFAANIEGARAAIDQLTPALEAADPDLLAEITAGFDEVEAELAEYADAAGGYVSYEELTDADRDAMQVSLAALSEDLSLVAGALGLG